MPQTRFPQPDWRRITEAIDSHFPTSEQDAIWERMVNEWATALASAFGSKYKIKESEHFILVSRCTDEKAAEILHFLQLYLRKVRSSLSSILENDHEGKCPVLAIQEIDLFYEYISDYIEEEGDYGHMGGIYLNRGYGHFAIHSHEMGQYLQVLAHELCHALTAALNLPLWLDEAIAQSVENDLTARNPYVLDRELIERHRRYWTEENIQDFWEGRSFSYSDEGQELSYHLARFLMMALYQGGHTDLAALSEFVTQASREDAGVGASRRILDVDLPLVLTHFLGEGDWEPRISI